MNTADYIVKKLTELGVTDIFGVPGDYNFNILTSIENNSESKWVGCTNELNAGYAADGYARLRGYGALVTTYGVGELSAINAIAGCYAENIPVVHIVGIPSTKNIENKTLVHHNFQNVNYNIFHKTQENVTAASAYLNKDNAKMEIDRVFKVLVKEKLPVYISVPTDIAKMEISDRDVSTNWNSNSENLKQVAEEIAAKINNSINPVILADTLIKRFDAKIEFKEFVSKLQAPVTNFLMGTNIINMEYEKYLGGYYSHFANTESKKYIDETDCLIAVGTIYSDLNAFGFDIPYEINQHIGIYGTYCYVNGKRYDDVKMSDLLECVGKLVNEKTRRIIKPRIGYEHKPSQNAPLTSDYMYPRIQEFIKENDIVIAETGIVPHGICQMKFSASIDIEFQTLWGSIGWGTPAALGACMAKPKSRVILITGEGSHQLTAMEIGNFLRQGIKPIVIIVNNQGYTIERMLSDNFDAPYNDIVRINYAKFARAFEGDIWATKVMTADDFDKALKVTQIMNKMCYIEVCIEKDDTPQLSKDMIKSFKEKFDSEKPIETIYKKEQASSFSEKSFDYETIVHQSITEEDSK